MQTRDIVSSSATILGLIITAFGIIVALGNETNQVIIKNFALVFIIIVILFSCSVIFTAISSLLEKNRLWTCALIVYIVGWVFLGTVMVTTLIGYAYGIEMFQIQLEQYNSDFVAIISLLSGALTGIIVNFAWKRFKKYIKNLIEKSNKLNVDASEIEYDGIMLQRESQNINQELIILRTEIERETRKLAELVSVNQKIEDQQVRFSHLIQILVNKEIITKDFAGTLKFVYGKLSKSVHGEVYYEEEARLILELGLKTLASIKKLIQKIEF